MEYNIVNILDLYQTCGEEVLNEVLSAFYCPLNEEVDYFLKNRALEFAKRKIAMTHIIVDEDANLLAYFSLAIKPITINSKILSNSLKQKLSRFAKEDRVNNSFSGAAFLLAQFGKNYRYERSKITGNEMMGIVIQKLKEIQHEIGGGIIYLDAENNEKLLEFYQNVANRFIVFGMRQEKDVEYLQLFRVF